MTFTVCHGFLMALIEIDGLPGFTVLKNGWIFHGKLLNNQMVILQMGMEPEPNGIDLR
jgi:hypothetical protein